MPFCICAAHQVEHFSWGYEAPNMEFYWSSTQTAEFLKVFLSLSDTFNLSNFNTEAARGVL